MTIRRPFITALLLMLSLPLSGCIAGLLPSLRTERVDVQSLGPQGLTLAIQLSATNDRYSGTILIDALRVRVNVGGTDLGYVDVPNQTQLPPNQAILIQGNVTVPLPNLPQLALQAAGGAVPYHLEGTAHVQNVGWSVNFSYDGEIPPSQLLGAGMRAIPFLLP